MPADRDLMKKIEKILRSHFHDNATVDVSESGIRENIHVIVVSREFDGMTEQQKQEHLWGFIDESDLNEEEEHCITMILPITPGELK